MGFLVYTRVHIHVLVSALAIKIFGPLFHCKFTFHTVNQELTLRVGVKLKLRGDKAITQDVTLCDRCLNSIRILNENYGNGISLKRTRKNRQSTNYFYTTIVSNSVPRKTKPFY